MSVAVDEGIEVRFPGNRAYLSAIREFVRELLTDSLGTAFDSRDLCEVQLAVQEACVNAIRHGNGDDATKLVSLKIAISPERVRFEVADEGPGFDLDEVTEVDEDEPREGGYGIQILRRTMENLSVETTGSGSVLRFDRRRRNSS